MPKLIPLEAKPNQTLSVRLDDRLYNLRFIYLDESMLVDIVRDNETLVLGQLCVVGTPLIPYQYLEDNSGNFFFQTENDNLPDYTRFGTTQLLFYFSNEELEELSSGA